MPENLAPRAEKRLALHLMKRTPARPAKEFGSIQINGGTRTLTVEIKMPELGENVTEGTIVHWAKEVGNRSAKEKSWWKS
jgi:hypothetical protein